MARARRAAEGARAGEEGRVPRGDGRADEGLRPVRRHHPAGVRRPRPAGFDLRQDRGADLGGVDVAHRDLQLAPDHGRGGGALRHRGAEEGIPAEVRQRRDSRRARAHRARLRHRPAGDPHPRAARRRPLRHQRHQDLDFERHQGLVLRAAGEDRPGRAAAPQGHEPVPGREGQGLSRLEEAGEARLQGHRLGRADLRGLPRAGGPPDRRRGRARLPARGRRARARAHQRRRARGGGGERRAQGRGGLFAGAARPSASRSASTRRSS